MRGGGGGRENKGVGPGRTGGGGRNKAEEEGGRKRGVTRKSFHDAHPVYEAQTSSGSELGPVGGFLQPLQVLSQQSVRGGAKVHETVGDDGGIVADRPTA